MRRVRKVWCLLATCIILCMATASCGKAVNTMENETEETETESTTEATTEIVVPVRPDEYREIPETLPKASEPVDNPGTREHFSFVENETQYVFTETDNLWLYNQSVISTCKTQFMLDVNGYKVVIATPATEEQEKINLSDYTTVYSDDVVDIYRKEDVEKVEEDELMYLVVYGVTYQITNWQELVNKHVISLKNLYGELAQMGTAIVPAEEGETLTDVISAMSATPVFEEYRMAFRDDVEYAGYIFCSPNSGNADYDDVSILMSFVVPEWEDYATIHVEEIPDYQDRLEDTGETFDEYPILVDYTGELKYFVIGNDGKCIYLDGVPGNTEVYTNNYSAKEAAYIFDLLLTK